VSGAPYAGEEEGEAWVGRESERTASGGPCCGTSEAAAEARESVEVLAVGRESERTASGGPCCGTSETPAEARESVASASCVREASVASRFRHATTSAQPPLSVKLALSSGARARRRSCAWRAAGAATGGGGARSPSLPCVQRAEGVRLVALSKWGVRITMCVSTHRCIHARVQG